MSNIDKISQNLSLDEKKALKKELQLLVDKTIREKKSSEAYKALLFLIDCLSSKAAQGSLIYSTLKTGIMKICKSCNLDSAVKDASNEEKDKILGVLEKFSINVPFYKTLVLSNKSINRSYSNVNECKRALKNNKRLKNVNLENSDDEYYCYLLVSYALGINGANVDLEEAFKYFKDIRKINSLSFDKRQREQFDEALYSICLFYLKNEDYISYKVVFSNIKDAEHYTELITNSLIEYYCKSLTKKYDYDAIAYLFEIYKNNANKFNDTTNKNIYLCFKSRLDAFNSAYPSRYVAWPFNNKEFVDYDTYCKLITVVLHYNYNSKDVVYVGSLLDHFAFKEANYLFSLTDITPKFDEIQSKFERINYGTYKRIQIFPKVNEYNVSPKNYFYNNFGVNNYISSNIIQKKLHNEKNEVIDTLILTERRLSSVLDVDEAYSEKHWWNYNSIESNYLYYTNCLSGYILEDDKFTKYAVSCLSENNHLKIVLIGSGDLREVGFIAKQARKFNKKVEIYVIDSTIWPINYFSLNDYNFDFTNIKKFNIYNGNFFEILNSNPFFLENSSDLILYFSRVINFTEKINNISVKGNESIEYFKMVFNLLEKYRYSKICIVQPDKVGNKEKCNSESFHNCLKKLLFMCGSVETIDGFDKSHAYILTNMQCNLSEINETVNQLWVDHELCESKRGGSNNYGANPYDDKKLKETIDEIRRTPAYKFLMDKTK